MTGDHKWMLRCITGAGILVLVLGILTAFQPGTSRLAVARLRILAGVQMDPFDEAPRMRPRGE